MFYRAPLCKPCGVKSGMGSCPKCEATKQEVKLVEQEMKQQIEMLRFNKAAKAGGGER